MPLCGLRYEEPLFITFAEQLFVNLFCYGAVMLAGLAVANARWLNERRLRASQLGAELARAQLRALEMQLRPHFLFNALHSVGALIRVGQAQAALRILAELGDLLRAILRGDGRHEATMNEELELALQYLRIEEVRFADRVESHVAVTREALAAFVPRLVLQPLLENAVRHGVERSLGKTRLDLRGTVEGGKAHVRSGRAAALTQKLASLLENGPAAAPRPPDRIAVKDRERRPTLCPGGRRRAMLRGVADLAFGCAGDGELGAHQT